MTSPSRALETLWTRAGGEPAALARVRLSGAEPALPSSFKVGTAAQATIAASALAAAEVSSSRGGAPQSVAVDMRHAAIEFRSERYCQVEGIEERFWDKIAGVYQTGDGRYVRLHTNFPHHRDGMLKLLGAEYDRASVARCLGRWTGEELEAAAAEAGLCAAMMRSPEEWAAHPQGKAVGAAPLLEIIRMGDAPARSRSTGERPLSGIRVLDLTRVIAGPVCGRTLAAHGADVLAITGPTLPFMGTLIMDVGRGKRTAHLELTDRRGRDTLAELARSADIFVQGYRPGAIAGKGFAADDVARLSPGIVVVSLCAYGYTGPWSGRRGFDSLVQTASGINHAEAAAAGITGPKELPCQALDHASGYLMAFGAAMALRRQMREGGSWHVRVSLAATGHWLTSLGRDPGAIRIADVKREDIGDLLERSQSGFGPMSAVRHAGQLSLTPPYWQRPSMPLGSHEPRW